MQQKTDYAAVLVSSLEEEKLLVFYEECLLDRLIRPAPIIYNRMGIKAKNLLFDDIFTGSHHFFLKVHGHDWILGGGLNNFNQLGK